MKTNWITKCIVYTYYRLDIHFLYIIVLGGGVVENHY